MSILNIAKVVWPFIKELLLADKTVKQAVKTNKVKLATAILLMMSVIINLFAIPRLYQISKTHLELVATHKKTLVALHDMTEAYNKKPVVVVKPPIPTPVNSPTTNKPKVSNKVNSEKRINELKKRFDKIKGTEEF